MVNGCCCSPPSASGAAPRCANWRSARAPSPTAARELRHARVPRGARDRRRPVDRAGGGDQPRRGDDGRRPRARSRPQRLGPLRLPAGDPDHPRGRASSSSPTCSGTSATGSAGRRSWRASPPPSRPSSRCASWSATSRPERSSRSRSTACCSAGDGHLHAGVGPSRRTRLSRRPIRAAGVAATIIERDAHAQNPAEDVRDPQPGLAGGRPAPPAQPARGQTRAPGGARAGAAVRGRRGPLRQPRQPARHDRDGRPGHRPKVLEPALETPIAWRRWSRW